MVANIESKTVGESYSCGTDTFTFELTLRA
jgi:hypothetical protein